MVTRDVASPGPACGLASATGALCGRVKAALPKKARAATHTANSSGSFIVERNLSSTDCAHKSSASRLLDAGSFFRAAGRSQSWAIAKFAHSGLTEPDCSCNFRNPLGTYSRDTSARPTACRSTVLSLPRLRTSYANGARLQH